MTRARLIAATVLVAATLSLSGCGFTVGLPEAVSSECPVDLEQEQPANSTATARLDESGVNEIKSTCRATFDLSSGQLLKEDVALQNTEYAPDVVVDGLLTLRLIGAQGTLTARTDHVRFMTTDSQATIDHIYYFLKAETPEEYFEIIRAGADAYGFDRQWVAREIEDMRTRPDRENKVAFAPGYRLGFGVIYDLRYNGADQVNTITVTVIPADDGTGE